MRVYSLKTGIKVLLLLALFATSYPAMAVEERKLALVIGNAQYTSLPQLGNASNDAEDMGAALQTLGFDVLVHTDLGKEALKDAIREFGQMSRTYDVLLFYFAGHGIELGGRNYLVPIDSDANSNADIRRTCVPAGSVINYIKFAKAKANIVIMDACRANPFRSGEAAQLDDGLALMDAPKGSIISFATKPGGVASNGTGRNGLFTEALLEHILVPDLEIKDMFERVRGQVISSSDNQQVPWESTSLTESLVLRRKPEVPLQVNILEGDSITFEGEGVLHAQANLQDVSFTWFHNGRQISNQASFTANKTGRYEVKVISRAGQILISDPIAVKVKSFVKLTAYIAEGPSITFNGSGQLNARSNVRGKFIWTKDQNKVGEGPVLEVELSGLYNLTVEASDGRKITTNSTRVIIKE